MISLQFSSKKIPFQFFFFLISFHNFSLKAEEKVKPIGIVYNSRYRGEKAFANRFKISASKINLTVNLIEVPDHDVAIIEDDYEFIVLLTPIRDLKANCPRYLALFLPDRNYFDEQRNLLAQYVDFDGFLMSFEYEEFVDYLFSIPNNSKNIFKFFPTSSSYKEEVSKPKKIFWPNASWGDRIDAKKYQDLFLGLQRLKMLDIFGTSTCAIPAISEIPFDDLSYFEKASEYGISLVIHSDIHRHFGIPTGRIFEALACANLIICDRHSFVEKHFGKNILYIDSELSSKAMLLQIKRHFDWIKKNPELARSMAQKAHEKFYHKFNLDDQIKNLIKFHQNLSKK
jgi:hypothetical protein